MVMANRFNSAKFGFLCFVSLWIDVLLAELTGRILNAQIRIINANELAAMKQLAN